MVRNALLSGLAVLALSVANASAQEAGGIQLSPGVMNTPNAQEQVVSHVLSRLQQLQQLRLIGGTPGAPSGANAAQGTSDGSTPGASTGSQQAISVAQQLRLQHAQMAQTVQPVPVAPPVTVVNAYGSPVTIGNNNAVRNQVVSSTVIGGGTATASANGSQSNSAATTQGATANATSYGGNAQAVAINSNSTGQGNNR